MQFVIDENRERKGEERGVLHRISYITSDVVVVTINFCFIVAEKGDDLFSQFIWNQEIWALLYVIVSLTPPRGFYLQCCVSSINKNDFNAHNLLWGKFNVSLTITLQDRFNRFVTWASE